MFPPMEMQVTQVNVSSKKPKPLAYEANCCSLV